MAESGGTSTQSGIYYQNSVAALYLGKLLDPMRANNDHFEAVRVEAPDAVDDIVVTYATGKKLYIQAKEKLDIGSDSWRKLWIDFHSQSLKCVRSGESFSLALVISDASNQNLSLKEACERSDGKNSFDEWWDSLSKKHRNIVENISKLIDLSLSDQLFELFRNIAVILIPFSEIEDTYCSHWIPLSNVSKSVLFSHLRDLVGGKARIRRTITCSHLLEELLERYDVEVPDAPNWGVAAYRNAIRVEFGTLEVPATSLSGSISDLFLWPELYTPWQDYQDFENEDLRAWREHKPKAFFELKGYPNKDLSKAVINSGAGLGKTTLLKALTHKLSSNPVLLPVYIPLSVLFDESSVVGCLNGEINEQYQVGIDWNYMSFSGRVVLFFDGLDELSSKERQDVLGKIKKYSARYPQVSYLLTVRDSSFLTTQLNASFLEIRRLSDEKLCEFVKAYSQAGVKIEAEELLEIARYQNDLSHLLRIPLFLSLMLATYNKDYGLPRSRTDILESYLDIAFSPEKYKSTSSEEKTDYLREVTERLAYEGLKKEHIGFSEKEILKILRDIPCCNSPPEYLRNLTQFGIMSQISYRYIFTYPTIQEYLAAQYMVENQAQELEGGFERILQRPWAQAMQFALESFTSSNKIIEQQLKKEDDAFLSSLRLIARCVVNGADVTAETKACVGDKLAENWTEGSYYISESIGSLLLDGYVELLPETARKYIIDGWALHHGGAKILSIKKDVELTKMVLSKLLSKDLTYKYHLHDWQDAVDLLAGEALNMYIDRALDGDTSDKEIDALRSLIDNLDCKDIDQEELKDIVFNDDLHPVIRLSVANKIPSLLLDDLMKIFHQVKKEWVFVGKDYEFSSAITTTVWKLPDFDIVKFIVDEKLSDDLVIELIESRHAFDEDNKYSKKWLIDLFEAEFIPEYMKFKICLMLANCAEFNSHDYAAERLNDTTIENVDSWCFLIGNMSEEISLLGLEKLRSRSIDGEEYAKILSSLSCGLNYIMTPTLSLSGTLDKKSFHPNAFRFVDWLIEVFSDYNFDAGELLKVLNDISSISQNSIDEEIESVIAEVIDCFDPSDDDSRSDVEWSITSGLSLCERENIQLSEECLLCIVSLDTYNVARHALNHLLKIASRDTFYKLLDLHRKKSDSFGKDAIFDALEKLSSRFFLRVTNNNGVLSVSQMS